MMQQVGNLRYCSMRQRARNVKLMLDWGAYGSRMQLMGLEESGKCPICMETDSLEHITFNCLHSAALHQRQTWVNGIQAILQNQGRSRDHKTGWLDNAREEILTELRDLCVRHPQSNLSGVDYGRNLCEIISKTGYTAPPQAGGGPKTSTGNS